MNLLKKLNNRSKEDKGASNTISFIVIMLFVFVLLVSFIDVGIYFNVKNEMRSAAENGARNVALYGGTEGHLRNVRSDVSPAVSVVNESISSNYAGGTVVNYQGAECWPKVAPSAGDSVWCEVTYEYKGIAGNFGFFQLGEDNIVKVKGVAISEVGQ